MPRRQKMNLFKQKGQYGTDLIFTPERNFLGKVRKGIAVPFTILFRGSERNMSRGSSITQSKDGKMLLPNSVKYRRK